MNQTHPSLDRLVDYTRGELPSRDDAAVHEHLAACAQCARAHDRERHLIDTLKADARAREREMPLGLAHAILARAKDDRSDDRRWSWSGFAGMLAPAAAAAVAAALVVAFIASFVVPRGNANRNAVDASAYIANHAALASTTPFEDGAAVPATLTANEGQ